VKDVRNSLGLGYRLLDKLGLDAYVLKQILAHVAGDGLYGVAFSVLGKFEGSGGRGRSETGEGGSSDKSVSCWPLTMITYPPAAKG
jgi:hypothetical protein